MKTLVKNVCLGFVIGVIYTFLIMVGFDLLKSGLVQIGGIMMVAGLIIMVIWWGRILIACMKM